MSNSIIRDCSISNMAKGLPLDIYLAQVHYTYNKDGQLNDSEDVWGKITEIFDGISSTQEKMEIISFPEICIPKKYFGDFINRMAAGKMKNNSIVIAGIELMEIQEFKDNIIEKIGIIEDKEDILALLQAHLEASNKKVNSCVVYIKNNDGAEKTFLQFKIFPSKYEHEVEKFPIMGDFLYQFKLQQVFNFLVVICSDMFNRKSGQSEKIIDHINRLLNESNEGLDYIFNIQYNPCPNHYRFTRSISTLYDDGACKRNKICIVTTNAILEKNDVTSGSGVLFYETTRLSLTNKIKQIDAPVVGYMIPSTQELGYFRFHSHLHDILDADALNIEVSNGKGTEDIYSIKPSYRLKTSGISTDLDLVDKLSQAGDYDNAILLAKDIAKGTSEEDDTLIDIYKTIAVQYRHKGNFYKSSEYYNRAAAIVNKKGAEDIRYYKIKAAMVMVDKYFMQGKVKDVLTEYIDMSEKYLGDDELNNCHAKRQIAEMRRMMGRYSEARQIYEETYKFYSYIHGEAKAYSKLGIADCDRMLGEFAKASDAYKEVETYANANGCKRLFCRVLRNRAELMRTWCSQENKIASGYTEIENILKKIKHSINENEYAYGALYYNLIFGGLMLDMNEYQRAKNYFEEIVKNKDNFKNYAHESTHGLLGMAECHRAERNICEAKEIYHRVLKRYEDMDCTWGATRTKVGLSIVDPENNVNYETCIGNSPAYAQKLFASARKAVDNSYVSLFINIP